jgi:hypothetical protein
MMPPRDPDDDDDMDDGENGTDEPEGEEPAVIREPDDEESRTHQLRRPFENRAMQRMRSFSLARACKNNYLTCPSGC